MTISCATANFFAMRTFYNFRRDGLIFIWNEENKIQRRKVAWSKPKQEDKDLCFLPLNANISSLSHLISFQMDWLRLGLNMFTLSPFFKKKIQFNKYTHLNLYAKPFDRQAFRARRSESWRKQRNWDYCLFLESYC